METGVVHYFASEIVSAARKFPIYGEMPAICLGNVTIQCVAITGGVAFEVKEDEQSLLFHDIEDASESFITQSCFSDDKVRINGIGVYRLKCWYDHVKYIKQDITKITALLRNPPIVTSLNTV